jgi:tetratricopeptide (TPR) repeat protein
LRAGSIVVATGLLWLPAMLAMDPPRGPVAFPSTQGGVNFAIGNHPRADGRGVVLPPELVHRVWEDLPYASVRVASEESGRPLHPVEASGWWFARGRSFWSEQPGAAALLSVRRAFYLTHGYEGPNNRSLYDARSDSPVLALLLWRLPFAYWPSGLLIPLAVVGVVVATAQRRRAWVPVLGFAATVLLPLILFFVCARFRAPAWPALALLAALGAGSLATRSPARWALFAGLYLVLNAPWASAIRESPGWTQRVRGEALFNAGRPEEARAHFEKALEVNPEDLKATLGLAAVAERRGELAEAEAYLRRAPALEGSWLREAALARVLDRQGRTAEAATRLRKAVADYPESAELQGRLGLTLEALGADEEAFRALEAAALRGTRDPEVFNSIGRYRRLAGDPTGAEDAWTTALSLDPRHFKARFNRGLLRAERQDVDAAFDDLERAVAGAPDPESRERALRALRLVRNRLP